MADADSIPEVDSALPTARFRRQHLELFSHSQALLEWRAPADVVTHAAELTRRLARFAGALRVHAAMEEEALYPRLLVDADASVQQQARSLLTEVGPIYEEVFTYIERWRRAELVTEDPAAFVRDTKVILRRLSERVTRETMELYPLVDERGG